MKKRYDIGKVYSTHVWGRGKRMDGTCNNNNVCVCVREREQQQHVRGPVG